MSCLSIRKLLAVGWLAAAWAVALVGGWAWAEEAAPPKFAKKPTVTKAGDKVRIEFAADRETDVAVFIEDAKGKVVRNLVAGRPCPWHPR